MHGACDPAPVTSTMAAELRDIVNFDDYLGKVDLAKLMGEGWPRNPNPQDPSLACICQVLCDAPALATVRSIEPFKPQNLDLLLGKLQQAKKARVWGGAGSSPRNACLREVLPLPLYLGRFAGSTRNVCQFA